MGKLKKSVDINASGDQVFELLTDLDRLPQWSTITAETHGTSRTASQNAGPASAGRGG